MHEKMNRPQTEALAIRSERHLQFLVVDLPTAVVVRQLEARDDIRIGAGRERRRNQGREVARVRRRRRRLVSAAAVGLGMILGGFVVCGGGRVGTTVLLVRAVLAMRGRRRRAAVGITGVRLSGRRSAVGLRRRWMCAVTVPVSVTVRLVRIT